MRILLILPVCLAVIACSSKEAPTTFDPEAKAKEQLAKERAADSRAVNAGFAPPAPAPLETVKLDAPKANRPGAILPAADREYRYIGHWAATPALCANGGWHFESRKLHTAGEQSCDFPTVAAVPNGYRLDGVCQSEGTKTEQTVQLAFNEANRSMSVRGKTLGPATLIYCGD